MKSAILLAVAASAAAGAGLPVVTLPGKSPLVSLSVTFRTGAAADPAGKPGVAAMTAHMLAGGGSKELTYKQILDSLFPMAAGVGVNVDKEMITFTGQTHVDNLEAFYKIFRGMLLEPGWRQDDFQRLRDDAVNYLRVSLRGNNDEELGKEVLYNVIFEGHPYGHHNRGTVSSIQKMAMADLQAFYKAHFTQANLLIGAAGGYPPGFLERMRKDFAKLPAGRGTEAKLPAPRPAAAPVAMWMVEKPTRGVAYSMGFPISVRRGHPDFPALLLAMSYFGQHRSSGGRLYERMRQARGLNYGDYSYIEHFPNGMFRMEPAPNLVRRQQIFQIWIRPVEPPTAHFALRLALYEFDKLVKEGLNEEVFARSRSFLSKQVNLLTRDKSAELGYAIDSKLYGIPDYNTYLKSALAKLTRDDVNRAIRTHLGGQSLRIVVIAQGCEELKTKLLAGEASPMQYNSPKPQDLLDEDKVVERWNLGLKAEHINIIPVNAVFE